MHLVHHSVLLRTALGHRYFPGHYSWNNFVASQIMLCRRARHFHIFCGGARNDELGKNVIDDGLQFVDCKRHFVEQLLPVALGEGTEAIRATQSAT